MSIRVERNHPDAHIEVKKMNLFDGNTLGVIMLLLLAFLVIVKRISTGSTIDVPRGTLPVRLINSFNLFFLLIVIPAISLLLITGQLEAVDPMHIDIIDPWLLPLVHLAGLFIYIAGHVLMGWALICLGRNYQIGGTPPRAGAQIITNGPFRLIRHPVYAAALCICLGLAVLTQSGILFGAFGLYALFINILIGIEEQDLLQNDPEPYTAYRQNAKRLIPFVY